MTEKGPEEVKMKTCNKGNKCVTGGPHQPITNFSKRKASADGHTYTCRACEKEIAKQNYHKRKVEGRTKMTPEEHEMRKQFYRDYYQENKERKKEYDEGYRKSEAGKKAMREGHARRRERLKDQKGEPYQRWEVIERDTDSNGTLRCQNPNCSTPGGKVLERVREVHMDHIVPVSQGGIDELANVRCVCEDCNLSRPKDGSDAK